MVAAAKTSGPYTVGVSGSPVHWTHAGSKSRLFELESVIEVGVEFLAAKRLDGSPDKSAPLYGCFVYRQPRC